jgi:hypothetical protein
MPWETTAWLQPAGTARVWLLEAMLYNSWRVLYTFSAKQDRHLPEGLACRRKHTRNQSGCWQVLGSPEQESCLLK